MLISSTTQTNVVQISSIFTGRVQNTSLAAPGALANRLQRCTARKANEANLGQKVANVVWKGV